MAFGEAELATAAADAGADGFLVVDLPPEESGGLRDEAVARGMDFVPLIAPTSHEDRVDIAAQAATSFVYYVSMTGVTGSKATDLGSAAERAEALSEKIGRPVALGFGVKTRDDVQTVAKRAAGVVVGSAVVRAVEAATDADAAVAAVSELVGELAAGTKPS